MSFWDKLKKAKQIDIKKESHSAQSVGAFDIPTTLSDSNAFFLASTVAEIQFPIDILADRASKLRYYMADKNDNELKNSELNRFITDINPFYSFNDIVYQYIYSLLSDGNTHQYVGLPSALGTTPSVSNITRLDILRPDKVEISEYNNINSLSVSNIRELIKKAKYCEEGGKDEDLILERLSIACIDSIKRCDSKVLSRSPQFKAVRNINNLLATYSARYNVYANNGAAGYLVKKPVNSNDMAAIVDPATRESMLADINNRNGITGRRNFWGISSIPIEFINTLSSIRDLMPFDETFANAVCIAGVYQIPSDLVPRKDNSTFDNQDASEVKVWENSLFSIVESMTSTLTKTLTLDRVGVKIKADYSSVGALKSNEQNKEAVTLARLENLKLIKEISPEKTSEVNKEIDKIILGYGLK